MNSKPTRLLSRLLGVLMVAASISAYPQEQTSGITNLFVELGTNALEQPENVGVGWALSAIGLSGPDPSANVVAELEKIDADLETMSSQLSEIFEAIETQTCNQAITAIETDVANIQNLYLTYQRDFVGQASQGNPIIPSQLDAWMTDMETVSGSLTNIATALSGSPGESSIISACSTAASTAYNDAAGNPFSDLTYYAPIQNLVNYYYGVQTQGVALIVEWLHLQACQSFTPNPCDFTTVSTNPPPEQAYNVCQGASGDAATFCSEAAAWVSQPDTTQPSGLYQLVTQQMIAAGAPYNWDGTIGIIAGSSILAPASLEDFTNNAEFVTGGKVTPTQCPSPLSSDQPCGYTVGLYNAVFDEGIWYANYGGVSGQSLWNNIPSSNLNTNELYSSLFNTYNVYRRNNTPAPDGSGIVVTGSVADYMNSIGFKNAADKIITFHDDSHKAFDKTAVCDIFTAVKKEMPYCNKDQNSAHVCAQTNEVDSCEDNENSPGTGVAPEITDVIDPPTYAQGFFNFFYECNQDECTWKYKPGWLKEEASNEKFYQYRWPMLDITTLNCTVRPASVSGTTTTPGYIQFAGKNANAKDVTYYTMCGNDLQKYIDALMPPPGTSVSQTLNANSFDAGHTLTVRATLNNAGISKRVDVFMGAVHPDGNTITFFTRLDPLKLKQGWADRPRSFRPIARNVRLASGVHSSEPYVGRYTFTGDEPTGSYEFFTAIVKARSLHDGRIDEGDIVAITTNVFEFRGAAEWYSGESGQWQ